MARRVRVLAAAGAVVVAGLLAGCGGGGGSSEDCTELTDAELQSVSEGLKFTGAEVVEGAWVPIPEDEQDLGYTRLAAVQVDQESEDTSDVATLATSEDGNWLAVDNLARLYFTWGEATEDDKPAGVWRDGMVGSETDQEAKACLD